ncbi:MAG TPA: DUF1819 family protein [Tepidimicrobium sp.]|nr:DUF1819 family protein [Tepidimicrobium sp.]
MINEVSKRIRALPKEVLAKFINLPVADQKILNLLGIMMTDRLFFEYMYDVYREKLIIGNLEFDNMDTRIFLENKSEQSEKVAGAYRTYLKEANLIVEDGDSTTVRKIILDIDLENKMRDKDLHPHLRVFLGE